MIKQMIARTVYEPLYHKLYKKDAALRYYKFYKKYQWNPLKENKKIQAKKLYELISYASQKIPYYKNIVRKKRIVFSEKNIFDDLRKFPVLTKDIIRRELDKLYYLKPNVRWYYNTSGGSTGEPVKIIQDYDYEAQSEAITRLQYEWTGCALGESLIKLWGSEKDIFQQQDKIRHRFSNWMKSIYLLNAFCMDEQKMRAYVDVINKKRPKLILAYTQSISELTNFIKQNNLKVFSPKAIMTSANVLHPHIRADIEAVFKCSVYDRYGSREVGNVACECEKHEGLHVNLFTHHIEILNKKLQPCREGEVGDIYITLLSNFTMPLIRYKIGDMATYTKKLCSCKRGLPLINDIVGRDNDLFINKRGQRVHTGIINMQFYFKDFIKKYHVIQKKKNKIMIRIVLSEKNKQYDLDKELNNIKNKLKKIMGYDCEIEFEITNDIQTTRSGKYRYTVREF